MEERYHSGDRGLMGESTIQVNNWRLNVLESESEAKNMRRQGLRTVIKKKQVKRGDRMKTAYALFREC